MVMNQATTHDEHCFNYRGTAQLVKGLEICGTVSALIIFFMLYQPFLELVSLIMLIPKPPFWSNCCEHASEENLKTARAPNPHSVGLSTGVFRWWGNPGLWARVRGTVVKNQAF